VNETYAADVIIVGCGPTGATLALLLAQCGVSSLVLEREADIYPLPRAVHFDDHIMRVFQALGVAEELQQVVRYNPGMRFVDPQGKLLLDWPRPQGLSENGWYSSYRFHQPDLEKILRKKIAASELITLATGFNVTHIEQQSEHITVFGEEVGGDSGRAFTGRFVVGCDGANSIVRKFISDNKTDFGFNERWLVIDAVLKREKPSLGDFTIQHCGRHRPATYVRCPGMRRRWEISLNPQDSTSEVLHESNVWAMINDWVSADEADIERSAVYEFKSLVYTQWRRDGLFIAGDAAHLTPPFMGQGMCAGIRDAANLAWKLGRCIQTQSHSNNLQPLLDSYAAERIPNVTEYITTAIELGALINSCSTTLHTQQSAGQHDGTTRMKSITPVLGQGLGAGSLAGRWFPQPQLQCGRLLDDVAGYRPVLIATGELLHGCKNRVPQSCLMLSADKEPALADCLHEYNAGAVVIRPDRYLLGGADNAAGLAVLLDELSAIA
jgi:3-(3-hydroxy-phenyl)propionate hydroxylase